MIGFDAVWHALVAAEKLGQAHKLTVDARLDAGRRMLMVQLRDAAGRLVCSVGLPAVKLDACETPQQVAEYAEREVANMLAHRPGRRAS